MLDALGDRVQRYTIVDLSGSLRARQQAKLMAHAHKLRWVDALPEKFSGVVVGNEVLDAMPVQLLARHGGQQGGCGMSAAWWWLKTAVLPGPTAPRPCARPSISKARRTT